MHLSLLNETMLARELESRQTTPPREKEEGSGVMLWAEEKQKLEG